MGHTATADDRRWGVPARVIALQLGAATLVALVALWWGADAAVSALLGGVVAVVPNAWFAWRLRGGEAAGDQSAVARAAAGLFGQWLVKLALTVTLMLAAITLLDAIGPAFFVGLAAALLAPLAAALAHPK